MESISPHEQFLGLFGPHCNVKCGLMSSNKDTLDFVMNSMKACDKHDLRVLFIKIIARTDAEIMDAFLDEGAWLLLSEWLADARDDNAKMVLNELADLFFVLPMSMKRLANADCAKLMKSLKKHPDEPIARKAKAVLDKWKEWYELNVGKSTTTTSSNTSKKASSKSSSSAASTKSSTATKSSSSSSKPSSKSSSTKSSTKSDKEQPTAAARPAGKTRSSSRSDSNSNSSSNKKAPEESPRKRKKCDMSDTMSIDSQQGLKMKIKKISATAAVAAGGGGSKKAVVGGMHSDKSSAAADAKAKVDEKVPVKVEEPAKPSFAGTLAAMNLFKAVTTKVKNTKSRMDFLEEASKPAASGGQSALKTAAPAGQAPFKTASVFQIPKIASSSQAPLKTALAAQAPLKTVDGGPAAMKTADGGQEAGKTVDDGKTALKSDDDDVPATLKIDEDDDPTEMKIVDSEPPKSTEFPSKGILLFGRSKQKFRVRFPPDDKLCQIRTFELNRDERTNVYRNAQEMKQIDMQMEANALHEARRVTAYKPWTLIEVDLAGAKTFDDIRGHASVEKAVQAERNSHSLEVFYMTNQIPDSPGEPPSLPGPSPTTNEQMVIIPVENPNCQEFEILPAPGKIFPTAPPPATYQPAGGPPPMGGPPPAPKPFNLQPMSVPNYTPDSAVYGAIPPPGSGDNGFGPMYNRNPFGLDPGYNPNGNGAPGKPPGTANGTDFGPGGQFRPPGPPDGPPYQQQQQQQQQGGNYWPPPQDDGYNGGFGGGGGQQMPPNGPPPQRFDNPGGGFGGGFRPRFNGNNRGPGGDFHHGPPHGPRLPRDQIVCKFFARFGNCRFREKCNYKHGEPDRRL